jgi:hypothetical protein
MSAEHPQTDPGAEKHRPRANRLRALGSAVVDRAAKLLNRPETIPLPDQLTTKSGKQPRMEAVINRRAYPQTGYKEYYSIGTGPEAASQALAYASDIFPQADLSVLSTEGSSAVILEDQQYAYKVMRDAHNYTYTESEMANLQLLHREGLAPRPYVLIDAALDERTERAGHTIRPGYEGEQIPRIDEGGKLPILVMDKIAYEPLSVLTPEQRVAEFDRIAEIATRLGIVFGDVEFVYDTNAEHVTVLDAGGVVRDPLRYKYGRDQAGEVYDAYPTLPEAEFVQADIITNILKHLSAGQKNFEIEKIADTMRDEGMEGLHALLLGEPNPQAADSASY